MATKRKKRQIRRKYKTVTFKLSVRQKKSLDKYSKARNTTPLKLIKRAIDTYISLPDDVPPPPAPSTHNQLDLFVEAELASELLNKIAENKEA